MNQGSIFKRPAICINPGISPVMQALLKVVNVKFLKQRSFSKESCQDYNLRWFETVMRFTFQLNFMKGLLICGKRLLLLVDSPRYNKFSTYQLLCSH